MKINVINATVAILLTATCLNAFGEGMVYKCKDQNGKLLYQKSACESEIATLDSWTPKEAAKPLLASEDKVAKNELPKVLTLKQNAGGHYETNGDVDGKPLNFIVDTGATVVALPEAVAHSALIYCDEKRVMDTANGRIDACSAKIKKLQLGPFFVTDVAAVIVPNLDQPLLGMNVLGLFKIAQNKGEMQLSFLDNEETTKK